MIILSLLIASCSVNEYGTSRISRWHTDTLVGYRATASGVHLDTRGRTPSLTIGRFEAFHIFPAVCDDVRDVAALSTEELFNKIHPHVSIRRNFGLQMVASPVEAGVTIGFREHIMLLLVDKSTAIRRRLTLDGTEFQNSQLLFEGKCGIGD